MADNVIVAGAGASCDGEYSLLNEIKTGNSRVWMLGESFRVYYNNGWKIANADISIIYYKLMTSSIVVGTLVIGSSGAGIVDPWDTENCTWVAVNQEYNPVPTVTQKIVNDTFVETYDETDEDGTIINVRKITNLSTGYVRYERTKNITVETPEITLHDRYTSPMLMLGRVYQFKFVSDFFSLGYGPIDPETEKPYPLKGIYRVDRLMTYFELVTSGIDLFANLYEPLNLSKTLYDKDFYKLGNTTIYKLTSVEDDTLSYYMPMIFIDGTPNSAINLYNKVMMSLDIGTHFDINLLTDMKTILETILEARWGIKGTVSLAIYDKTWMPESHYETLVEDREEAKKALYLEHGNVLADTLFYVEENKLYKKYLDVLSKLNAYEEILEAQQGV